MPTSPLRRHCYFSKSQMARHHLRHAQRLLASGNREETEEALLGPIALALQLYPSNEAGLELKSRALLSLNRFKDIVDLLHEYLPTLHSSPSLIDQRRRNNSYTIVNASSASLATDHQKGTKKKLRIVGMKPLAYIFRRNPSTNSSQESCGSSSNRYNNVSSSGRIGGSSRYSGSHNNSNGMMEWRYLILGQACYHLGMLEEATILLQSGKKSASDASRRYSNGIREDDFNCPSDAHHNNNNNSLRRNPTSQYPNGINLVNDMITHIKLLLRRRSAALVALESGLYAESIRHLSKIVDGKKGVPPWFLADCYLHRAIGYQALGKVVDALADCNRNLALNPRSTKALSVRASLQEMVKNFTECLLDLQQLKMVFEASQWEAMHNNNNTSYSSSSSSSASSSSSLSSSSSYSSASSSTDIDNIDNISSGLEYINSKIIATRRRLGSCTDLDARMVLDMPQHCGMDDVEKAYLLLSLKHSPDKSAAFLDNCLQLDGYSRDMTVVKDEAKASSIRLSKLIHKAYTKLLAAISEREREEREGALYRKARSLHCYGMEGTLAHGGVAKGNVCQSMDSGQEDDLRVVLGALKEFKISYGNEVAHEEEDHWFKSQHRGPWTLDNNTPHPQPLFVT